jgi:hypothetical protein
LYKSTFSTPAEKAAWKKYIEAYNAAGQDASSPKMLEEYKEMKASLSSLGAKTVNLDKMRTDYSDMIKQRDLLYSIEQVYNVEPLREATAGIAEVQAKVTAGDKVPPENEKGEAYSGLALIQATLDDYNKEHMLDVKAFQPDVPVEPYKPVVTHQDPIIEPIVIQTPIVPYEDTGGGGDGDE